MTFKFREYTLHKLLATGMLKIDMPGIITYNNSGFLGSKKFNARAIYLFEEIYSNLYLDTLKKLGKKKTEELWYKIGKDVSMRYLLHFRGIDKSSKNIPKLINYFSTLFSFLRISNIEEVSIHPDNSKFTFSGSIPQRCKDTGSISCVEGVISGMMSFILNENVETKSYFTEDEDTIIIIASKGFEERYYQCDNIFSEILERIPNLEKNKSIFSGLSSFKDFFKFKVVELSDDGFKLSGKNLMAQDIGIPTIFSNNYSKIAEKKLFEKSILKSSENICYDLFKNHETVEKRIRVIRNICSATGLGEIYFTRLKEGVTIGLLNPFFIRGESSFIHLFFNGILNVIYDKKLVLKFRDSKRFEYLFK